MVARIEGHCEAKKHSYRQTQDGVVISFVVHPNDVSPALAAAALGTVFMLGYAEVVDGEPRPMTGLYASLTPEQQKAALAYRGEDSPIGAAPEAVEQAKERRPFHELSLSTQAGILCADPRFSDWLGVRGRPEMLTEDTARHLRERLCITSRKELGSDRLAADRFKRLVEQYRRDTGLEAAPR